MYQTSGTIEFNTDNPLLLKDAQWKVKGVKYDWQNNTADIEVYLSDDDWTNIYSRTYSFTCSGVWSDTDALNAVLGLDAFKNSTAI